MAFFGRRAMQQEKISSAAPLPQKTCFSGTFSKSAMAETSLRQ